MSHGLDGYETHPHKSVVRALLDAVQRRSIRAISPDRLSMPARPPGVSHDIEAWQRRYRGPAWAPTRVSHTGPQVVSHTGPQVRLTVVDPVSVVFAKPWSTRILCAQGDNQRHLLADRHAKVGDYFGAFRNMREKVLRYIETLRKGRSGRAVHTSTRCTRTSRPAAPRHLDPLHPDILSGSAKRGHLPDAPVEGGRRRPWHRRRTPSRPESTFAAGLSRQGSAKSCSRC